MPTDHAQGERPDVDLARAFAEIARTLLAEDTLPATLTKICQLAVTTIDGWDHAAITLVQRPNAQHPGSQR